MTHRKESVKAEAEIDYQAKKNVSDKLSSEYKKARKRKKKLTEELMSTVPSREHKWHGLSLKESKESKRIKKELKKEKSTLKFIDKHEKYLEKDKLSALASYNKDKLLSMGVYRKTKGGEVLEAPSKSKYQRTNLPSGPRESSVYKGKTFANRYKKKLNYTQ